MIEQVFNLSIITTKDMSIGEIQDLIDKLQCAELARDAFLASKISFEELIDIYELCGVNVDEYLLTLEENLKEIS
jgi:hypothetical protein